MPSKRRMGRVRYSRTVEKAIYEKHRHRCAICGRTIDFDDGVLDHIIPLGKGGADTATNLQWTCYRCNILKGDSRTNEEVRAILGTPKDFDELVKLQDKEGPSFVEIQEPRTVLSYDWIHSTKLDPKKRDFIVWQGYEILQRYIKHIGDGDLDPTFDDSNIAIFRKTDNAIRSTLNYVRKMEDRGILLRASVISNLNLGTPWNMLKWEKHTRKYAGSIFAIATRARNYFKENRREREGESYIFMSTNVKEVFEQLIEPEKRAYIIALGRVELRDLLPIELYVYIHTKESIQL